MPEYRVINSNAPYFVWRDTQKKRAGNLGAGAKVSGEILGSRLIINYDITGADGTKPFCMYLTDLTIAEQPQEPPTEPPPTEPPSGLPDVFYEPSGHVHAFEDEHGNSLGEFIETTESRWERIT